MGRNEVRQYEGRWSKEYTELMAWTSVQEVS